MNGKVTIMQDKENITAANHGISCALHRNRERRKNQAISHTWFTRNAGLRQEFQAGFIPTKLKYSRFNETQKITSDFDKAVKKMLEAGAQHEQIG